MPGPSSAQQETQQNQGWEAIPQEILLLILRALNPSLEELLCIALTCKHWQYIAYQFAFDQSIPAPVQAVMASKAEMFWKTPGAVFYAGGIHPDIRPRFYAAPNPVTRDSHMYQVFTHTLNPIALAVSEKFTAMLTKEGAIYVCGYSAHGALGLREQEFVDSFTALSMPEDEKAKKMVVSRASTNTWILMESGRVYACGDNTFGQLGLNDRVKRTTLTHIPSPQNETVKEIASFSNRTLLLMESGRLYHCGANWDGLGAEANRTDMFVELPIPLNEKGKKILLGFRHTLVLMQSGRLYGCGYGLVGQLGLEDRAAKTSLTHIPIPADESVKDIAVGPNHTLVLMKSGRVYGCGHNQMGELGLGDRNLKYTLQRVTIGNDERIVAIDTAAESSLFLAETGKVFGCGDNSKKYFGAGFPDYKVEMRPVLIPGTSNASSWTQKPFRLLSQFFVENPELTPGKFREVTGPIGQLALLKHDSLVLDLPACPPTQKTSENIPKR